MTQEESQNYHDTKQKELLKELEDEKISEEEYNKYLYQYPKTKIVDEKFFNQTVWDLSQLHEPVLFICQKNKEEKSAIKLLTNLTDVKFIRSQIKYLSEPAYYTDSDNILIENQTHNHQIEWLVLVYEKSDNKHPLISHFKTWARSKLFQLNNLKLAVLDDTELTMLNLERSIETDKFLRLYYFKYPTGSESLKLKHRMLDVQNPNQLEKALNWIQEGIWDPYYFSETINPKDNISKYVKKLVRTNYFSTIEDRSNHLLIMASNRAQFEKFSGLVEEFYKKAKQFNLEKKIEFFHINSELNDLSIDLGQGIKYMFHHKDREEVQTNFNIDTLDGLVRFVIENDEEFDVLMNINKNNQDL